MSEDESLKGRVTRQGEEAIGRLAADLLENPLVSSALSAAFETRERAMRAQEVAMGALNLPSAADLERLTRRVRSVSQRLEGIEDGLDRLDGRLERPAPTHVLEERLERIEQLLARLEAEQAPTRSAGKRTPSAGKRTAPAGKRTAPAGKRTAPAGKRTAPAAIPRPRVRRAPKP